MFKKLVNKIKYIFKGKGDIDFEFEGKEIDGDFSKENAIKQPLVLAPDSVSNDYGLKVSQKGIVFNIPKIDKRIKREILQAAYGKDKLYLINIMIRTRKLRIKKKLIKRIVNS